MAAKPPARKRSLYDILGVPRDAMALDIGMAYKKRLAELDRKPDADPNEVALVREAYHILCQPKEREAYDASLLKREEIEEAKTHGTDIVLDIGDEDEVADASRKKKIYIGAGVAVLAAIVAAVMVTRSGGGDRTKALTQPAVVAETKEAPPPPPPPPKTRTANEILGIAAPVVAGILAYDISGKPQTVGNGILFAPNAIVTTCHALPPSATIVTRVGIESLPANLTIFDEDLDLCRLTIGSVSAAPLAPSTEEPKAGDTVFAVGYHQGSNLSVAEGTAKAVRSTPKARYIDLSFTVVPGANGGALFDQYGRLIGVLTTLPSGGSAAIVASSLGQMRTRGQAPPAEKQ